ncbi:putative disease resistance protein RGA3 [Heracleum sosnowskyi]|uniref:Disease resistance protein RGA3 n=1 Tax=Heracleum sosnowskyi TaxID=360622 RepID=A0AAD8MDR9_9APIA|nr:putative disease resistance protein RGA3 [Heracleum sosnowskyi]
MGGQGKTTLARMVFHSDDVTKMFRKRMWITVSNEFQLINILNEMVESLTSTKSQLKNSHGLINELQKCLKAEKFLLVLDDVWNEELVKWEDLKNSLLGINGAKGSSVVVTTRNQKVVDAIQNSVPYPVGKLLEHDSYKLFKKIAFRDEGVLEMEPFVTLGKSMVERCGGLPLAIKALGGLLQSKTSEQEWQEIQNSDIWTSKDVLSSLRLSYDNLPYSSLKRCFVYCSIIPKDSLIYKDELIQIWMALGFLLPPWGSNALMEDIGSEYFNILLWHSLLQDVTRDEFGNIESCKMHDLVHDLALDLSKHHSITVKTGGPELNHVSRATYLRLDKWVSDRNPKFLKRYFERVQLLYAGASVLGDVLPYIAHLTVLVLNSDRVRDKDVGELLKTLRNMKFIKHLDISRFRCKLPSYITEFYNLQTLRVSDVEELPKNFCNLINLRHFYIEKSKKTRCRCTINGIERLTCLQTLPHFVVSKDQNCLIGQLEGLHNLRGKVDIYGLREVANMEEASKAKLCTKSNIHSLLLNWSNDKDGRPNNNEDGSEDVEYNNECVFEGLKPHTNLKKLIVEYFLGKRLPSWIKKMTNLFIIRLLDCKRCEEFPSLGHLPKLREMKIENMSNLRIIGSHLCAELGAKVTTMYPSLTKLSLWDLPKLEEWLEPDTSRGNGDQSSVQVFPKLEVLTIVSCSKLKRMPDSYFPFLKKLIIIYSDKMLEPMSIKVSSLRDLQIDNGHIGDEGSSSSLNIDPIFEKFVKNNYQSLRNLGLHNCHGLTCLTVAVGLEQLTVFDCPDLTSINIVEETTCLKDLNIRGCPSISEFSQSLGSTIEILELDEIPRAFLSSVICFPNLTKLTLRGYGKVQSTLELDESLVSAFSGLTWLSIHAFMGLKALPDTVAKFPSLEELTIWDCIDLESLPTFDQSHSIRCLDLRRCGILEGRCEKDSGPEWYKIQHIPTVIRSSDWLNAVFGVNFL